MNSFQQKIAKHEKGRKEGKKGGEEGIKERKLSRNKVSIRTRLRYNIDVRIITQGI